MTQWYKADFYGKDRETGKMKFQGSVNVNDDCVTDELPLATKAFRSAPPQVRSGADRVTFSRVYR